MNAYNELLEDIEAGQSAFSIMLSALLYYMIGKLSEAHFTDILTRLSYTWDSTNHTVSDGTNTYTVYQLIDKCITDIFPNEKSLSFASAELPIKISYENNYITADEAAALTVALEALV
jgi:hypothetical protein